MFDLRKIDLAEANLEHEKARLRRIDTSSPEEMARLWEIEKDELVARFVEGLAEDQVEMDDFLRAKKDRLAVAIEGKAGHVDETEVGKLQGWLFVYPDEKKRIERCKVAGLVALENESILEIAFARHPRAKSGQVASALRQFLGLLNRQSREGEKIIVTAYTDLVNEASMRVLTAAGFANQGKVKYHQKNINHDYLFVWAGSEKTS